jgi:hypothetical protein
VQEEQDDSPFQGVSRLCTGEESRGGTGGSSACACRRSCSTGRGALMPPGCGWVGEETSCPACWRAPRPVKFLAHAYATCAVMRELDTIMFVRDSCSKQLDSDRLAAYVPQFSSRPSLVPSVTVVLFRFSDRWERGEGRLAKPGAGLIQPLCRRDGHGRPG